MMVNPILLEMSPAVTATSARTNNASNSYYQPSGKSIET
jgi:hypothetical protein